MSNSASGYPPAVPAAPAITAPAAMSGLHHRARARVRVPVWPIVIVIYSTLVPREVCIHIGENFLYMDRIAMLLAMPMVANALWRGAIKFVLPDWLILFFGVWLMVAVSQVHGFQKAIVTGASLSFDQIAGYYLARVTFRSLDDIRRALILVAPGFFLAGLSVAIESVTHYIFVRPIAAAIFGNIHFVYGIDDAVFKQVRFGLMRGNGPWIHPILAGLHLSTLLAIYWMSGIRGWPRLLALLAAFFSIFSISSAGILALTMLLGCLSFDWLCRRVAELNWRWVVAGLVVTILLVETISNRGLVGLVVVYATYDPGTGYFRQMIYTYGMMSVWAHPWFGIGFNDYVRPAWMLTPSVDNHFLLTAMRYGIPAAVALLAACLSAIVALIRSERYATEKDARFYRGIIMSFAVLTLMSFTVMLNGGTQTWFTLLLGGCVACAQHGFSLTRRSAGAMTGASAWRRAAPAGAAG